MLDLENCFLTTAVLSSILVAVITIFVGKQIWNSLQSPGPWGIPFFGYYPFLGKNYYLELQNLNKKYGNAYFITICGKRYLHLSSYEVMQEVYLTKHSCFTERIDEYSLIQLAFKNSVFLSKGDKWQVMRRFFIRSLRELGFGTPRKMKESVEATISLLSKNIGKPIDIVAVLTAQCIERIKHLTMGESVSEENSQKLRNATYQITRHYSIWNDVSVLLNGNIIRYLIAPWNIKFRVVSAAMEEFQGIFNVILKEHKSKLGSDDSADFISLFLREKRKRKDKNDPQAQYFDDKTHLALMLQMYVCGGLGIGLHMSTLVKILAENKDIQDIMYEEIVREVGTCRFPTYEDKIRLPYAKAVIMEFQRVMMVVPVVPDRVCNRDTMISGIHVPKGSITLVNFYALHHDPAVYKNPECFDPTRFFDSTIPDENGKQLQKNPLMTFGIGKRTCIAEQLFSTELFLFVTALIQIFTLRLANVDDYQDLKKESESSSAIECQIIFSPRQSTSTTI